MNGIRRANELFLKNLKSEETNRVKNKSEINSESKYPVNL